MAGKEPLDFSIESGGGPLVLRAVRKNGEVLRVRVGLAVFAVIDTGVVNADGSPGVEVKINVPIDAEKVQ